MDSATTDTTSGAKGGKAEAKAAAKAARAEAKAARMAARVAGRVAGMTDKQLAKFQARLSRELNALLESSAPDAQIANVELRLNIADAESEERQARKDEANASEDADESGGAAESDGGGDDDDDDGGESTAMRPAQVAGLEAKLARKRMWLPSMPTAKLERMAEWKSERAAEAAARGNDVRAALLTAFVDDVRSELAGRAGDEKGESGRGGESAAGGVRTVWMEKVPQHVLFRVRGKMQRRLSDALDNDEPEEVAYAQARIDALNAEIAARKEAGAGGSGGDDETDEDGGWRGGWGGKRCGRWRGGGRRCGRWRGRWRRHGDGPEAQQRRWRLAGVQAEIGAMLADGVATVPAALVGELLALLE